MRVRIEDTVIYEGAAIAVPRHGERIHHEDQVLPVEAVTWTFAADGDVTVDLVLGAAPYTF